MHDDTHRYHIVPVGSGPVGWAIERDGRIWRTGPRIEVLGAWLDACCYAADSACPQHAHLQTEAAARGDSLQRMIQHSVGMTTLVDP